MANAKIVRLCEKGNLVDAGKMEGLSIVQGLRVPSSERRQGCGECASGERCSDSRKNDVRTPLLKVRSSALRSLFLTGLGRMSRIRSPLTEQS